MPSTTGGAGFQEVVREKAFSDNLLRDAVGQFRKLLPYIMLGVAIGSIGSIILDPLSILQLLGNPGHMGALETCSGKLVGGRHPFALGAGDCRRPVR